MTPAPISVERLRELLAVSSLRLPLCQFGAHVDGADGDTVADCYYNAAHEQDGRDVAELFAAAVNALPALLHQLAEREADLEREQGVREDAQRQLRVALNDLHDMRWMYAQELKRAEAAERAREGDRAALAKLERECRTYQGQHENAYVDHQRDGRESYHPGRAIANTFKWMGDRIAAFLAASGEK